jgi:hypothetical protein
MKTLIHTLAFVCLSACAFAQSWTTVLATNITDLNQQRLAAGNLCFLITDQNDTPISVGIGGGGQSLQRPYCATVTNGIAGSFTVPNPAGTMPSGIYYRVTVTDSSTGQTVLRYSQVSFTGAVFNFDAYAPVNLGQASPLTSGTTNGSLFVNGNLGVSGVASAVFATGGNLQVAGPATIGATTSGLSLTSFGDSITACFGVSTLNCWPYEVAHATGMTLTDSGFSGASAQDDEFAGRIFRTTVSAGQRFTAQIGQNDMRIYQLDTTKQNEFQQALSSTLAWLGLVGEDVSKYRAASGHWTYSGSGWASASHYGSATDKCSAHAGDTASIAMTGTTLYLSMLLQVSNASTFAVSIDGARQGTYSATATATSYHGHTYSPGFLRYTGLSNTAHTVLITVASASGGDGLCVLWAGAPAGNGGQVVPAIALGNVLDMTSAAYTALGGSDTAVANYNSTIANVASNLIGDGLNIVPVDLTAVYSPTASPSEVQADGLHPNEYGNAIIAYAYAGALREPFFSPPGDGGAEMLRVNGNSSVGSLDIAGYMAGSGYTRFLGYKARGTLLNPTPPQAGDPLVLWGARIWDGTQWGTVTRGGYILVADENMTASAQGTHLDVYTTPDTTTAVRVVGTWPQDGGLQLKSFALPTCDAAHRGTFFVVNSGAGVKDTVSVCAKDAADAYAWRAIY